MPLYIVEPSEGAVRGPYAEDSDIESELSTKDEEDLDGLFVLEIDDKGAGTIEVAEDWLDSYDPSDDE